MQEYSTSSVKGVNSRQPDTSNIVPIVEKITPISTCSEKTNEIDLSDAMDMKEEDKTRMPKKKKVE